MSFVDNRYFIRSRLNSIEESFRAQNKMKFLSFMIFVSLLIVNVKSLGFYPIWNDLLRSKKTDNNTDKGYIGMKYTLLPSGVC